MISAQDFWQEHLGRHIFPSGDGWKSSLMTGYPHAERKGLKTRLGGSEPGRFLISERGAQVWAPVLPDVALPDHIQFQVTADRKRRDWIVDIITSPPPTPFLAASVGMSGADADFWKITTSSDLISFGGSAALFEGLQLVTVNRARFMSAKIWFEKTGTPVSDLLCLLDIRAGFQSGILTGEQARSRVSRIGTSAKVLEQYPGDPEPVLIRLAAYAANYWEAQ